MSEVAIKVDGVSKNFKITHGRSTTLKSHFVSVLKGKKSSSVETQHALRDISFEVNKGEFFGIVGRNGSGKSTLLKMLAGIYQPTKGKIQVQGKLVPFIELGVGFNPELTGRENVFLNGALLGFSEKDVAAFYDEVVAFAELEKFMDKKLKNYSSGMQVRLAFSMAIQAKADILLIDEVLAVGDADFQRKCFNYFKQLKKSKTTVVFVTHDMNAVRQFCDSAMLIGDGVIKLIGGVDEVALEYTKLFTHRSDNESVHSGRTKSKSIQGLKVKVGEDVAISGTLTPQADLDDPLFGFIVKDAAGTPVLGFNSKMINKRIGLLPSGTRHDFKWQFPNILSDGEYTVDLALLNEDGVTIIDWWDEATDIKVKKTIISPYPVTPDTSLTIKESK